MGHGGPDWSTAGPLATVYTIEDMAELAARLGSINIYDRRGNVIYVDDFEGPLINWYPYGLPAGWNVYLYPAKASTGCQSLYLDTKAEVGARVGINRRFRAAPNQRFGIETEIVRIAEKSKIDVEMYGYTGKVRYQSEWRYDPNTEELLIWLGDDDWKVIGTHVQAHFGFGEWWNMKLVVDVATLKYVRGLFLGKEYDLSDEVMWSIRSDSGPLISPAIEINATTNAVHKAVIDNVIITQNEP